jgi:DNA polymerase/3'-5' exonuclease PolX
MEASLAESQSLAADADDKRWAFADAVKIAREVVDVLKPHCEKLIVAGSLRRRKAFVSDIEILFIPAFKVAPDPNDLFGNRRPINQAELVLDKFLESGLIAKRLSSRGSEAWGPLNKLGVHVASGMPIDFFTASRENWYNFVVVRTGGAENNKRIASAAIARGWNWHAYGSGFSRANGLRVEHHHVESERDCFDFVALPYLEPAQR